jgi:DNA-binding LacI/PurR family transcriptional regulator
MFRVPYRLRMVTASGQGEPEVGRRISVDRDSRVPLATQVSRQFTWLIATGALEEGSLLPPISKLAGQVGINTHTMRAAYGQLRDDGLVRVQRGSRTVVLGYDRGLVSAAGDRHSSFTIGVLIPSFTSYYSDFLEAVASAAGSEGWLPIICETHHFDAPVVSGYLDQLFSHNVDGVIAIHAESTAESDVVELFEPLDTLRPLVLVDSADLGRSSPVTVDREADGLEATAHLIGHGHRRVALLSGPAEWASTQRMVEGYREALAGAPLPFDDALVAHASDHAIDAGAATAQRLLFGDDPPSAIFCTGDVLALGAIKAVGDAGKRVPEDVAVIGYGDIPFAALSCPSLSSIRLPAAELGRQAVRILRQAVDDGSLQPPVTVDTTLVLRHSCGCSPSPTEGQRL